MAEEKEYFNRKINVNSNREQEIEVIGCDIDKAGFDEYKILGGMPIEVYDKKKGEKENLNLNEFIVYYGQNTSDIRPNEPNELPINSTVSFAGTNIDANTIETFFYAGVYSYAYRMYNSHSEAKKNIDASTFDKQIFESEQLKAVVDAFNNGRSSLNENATEGEELAYISNVKSAYKEFKKFIQDEKLFQMFYGNENSIKKCLRYETTANKILKNEVAKIVYKDGDGDKAGDKAKKYKFSDLPTRSCQLLFMAFCASRSFYDYSYIDPQFGPQESTFKKGKLNLPTTAVYIYKYKNVISTLREELLNKNNNGKLKTIKQGQIYSSYNPYTNANKKVFKNLDGIGTTESLKRNGLDKILIHFTAGDRTRSGYIENANNGQAAANFYVSTGTGDDNLADKPKEDIIMSAPHECWVASVDKETTKEKDAGDMPYSNKDIYKKIVRLACKRLYKQVGDIKVLNEINENDSWNTLIKKGKERSKRYKGGTFLSQNAEEFRNRARIEVKEIAEKYNYSWYNAKDGTTEEGKEYELNIKDWPLRLGTNQHTIAIETAYGADVAGGKSTGESNAYQVFYGGINLIEQDKLKNLKYVVRYLLDKYGKDTSCLMRHFDHGGKACPYGFVGNMAWNYLKMYIGGLDGIQAKEGDPVTVSKSDFLRFVAKYIGETDGNEFEAAKKFAERWNGINASGKEMEWSKELNILTNGSMTRIKSQTPKGIFTSSKGKKAGDINEVVFETLLYTETPKDYKGQGYIPAQSFYIEETTIKFFDNCRIPEDDEEISEMERGEELPQDDDEDTVNIGEEEEKKVSINQVRSFINKWICVDKAGADNNQNVSQGNSSADNKGGPQELLDVQNYYDFLSGMTAKIQAKFRGVSQDKKKANWIGLDSLTHPYFESLNIKDTGVKQATLVLYDKDFASYQLGVVSYNSENKKTIYSLEQIIKQAIGTCVIAKAETNKLYNTKDYDNAEISDDFLTFKESEELGPANLRLRWGYADYNLKTTYRKTLNSKGEVVGYHYAKAGEEGATAQNERLTKWEEQLGSSIRTNRWWEVEWQDDKDTFQVSPSKYIVSPGVAAEQTPGEGKVTLKNSSDRLNGEEGVNVSRDVLMKSENSTCLITPWIDFMIVGLKTELTDRGLRYTINAIESKDAEVLKTRFLQKYAQISTYPEEVLYILMSIFNENPISGEIRKKSKIKLLLYKEKSDPRAFINNELDFSNMPEELREKFEDFTDTYTMDNANPQLQLSEVELEKYLKKITLSFGSADALKANYDHKDSKDRPNLYKSVASLMNEFCAACPPRKEKQMKPVTTDEGMVVKADTTGEAARPLKWFTCKRAGDNETTYVVLYYRRALRPRKIRSYIWGPHNPYQTCVKSVSIENANEFAVLAGIEAFNEKSEKETKLKYAKSDANGNQGVFGQGMVDVKRTAEKKFDEKKMDEGEAANYIFTDIKSRNNYQEAYSNSVYQGTIEILGDPFYTFDGLMQPCTYPIRLDVLIPFNGFHTLRGGNSWNSQFEAFDSQFNTFYDDGVYGNQRRHEISGYYVIKSIEHNISSNGKFTTKLDVISYPQIEEQILDKKDGKPIFPKFKETKRHAKK